MKTRSFIIFNFALCILLTSCTTPLYIEPIKKLKGDFGQPNMEFIGFMNNQRDEYVINLFKNFGRELEKNHIALNYQQYSLGSQFNVEDLKDYSSSLRYVSFINITKLKITYNDEILDNVALKKAAGFVAGFTLFTWFYVYLPMLCAADENKTQQNIKFQAELYIYDTLQKEVVKVIPVDFKSKEIYIGQYKSKQTDKRLLMEAEKSLLTNVLLEYYGLIHEELQKNYTIR